MDSKKQGPQELQYRAERGTNAIEIPSTVDCSQGHTCSWLYACWAPGKATRVSCPFLLMGSQKEIFKEFDSSKLFLTALPALGWQELHVPCTALRMHEPTTLRMHIRCE